jgi:hypothetical protein
VSPRRSWLEALNEIPRDTRRVTDPDADRRFLADYGSPSHDQAANYGSDLPTAPCATLSGAAPDGLLERLMTIGRNRGYTVELSAMEDSRANGDIDHLRRRVRVRADLDAGPQVKTAAHELGHACLEGDAGFHSVMRSTSCPRRVSGVGAHISHDIAESNRGSGAVARSMAEGLGNRRAARGRLRRNERAGVPPRAFSAAQPGRPPPATTVRRSKRRSAW